MFSLDCYISKFFLVDIRPIPISDCHSPNTYIYTYIPPWPCYLYESRYWWCGCVVLLVCWLIDFFFPSPLVVLTSQGCLMASRRTGLLACLWRVRSLSVTACTVKAWHICRVPEVPLLELCQLLLPDSCSRRPLLALDDVRLPHGARWKKASCNIVMTVYSSEEYPIFFPKSTRPSCCLPTPGAAQLWKE